MIWLHKLNGAPFILNSAHIEKIEELPDTTITMMNDRMYLVQESGDEIIRLMIAYSGSVFLRRKGEGGDEDVPKTIDRL